MKAIAPILCCVLLLVFGWCLTTPASNVQTLDLTYEPADLALPITADTQAKDVKDDPAASTDAIVQVEQLAFLSNSCRSGRCEGGGRSLVAVRSVEKSTERKVTREATSVVKTERERHRVTPARTVFRAARVVTQVHPLRRLLRR